MSESASASADEYADYSREQLLAEINRLKKNKKYGLVWEHKKEQVIEDFETQQPYLQEVAEKRIENAPGEPTNLIIEGDNFEALSILNYTHAGKVDVIYIDPPYNTGNKDFIYNDNYVDSEDEFRHSKWLSFMEPRLKLAKNLLSIKGVVFISIDDREAYSLKLLCDDIFDEKNFLTNIIWNSTKSVTNTAIVSNSHTHTLVYFKDSAYWVKNRTSFRVSDSEEGFSNPDNDPRGPWKADPFQVGGWRPNQQYEILNPKTGIVYRPNKGCSWKNDHDKFLVLQKENRIVFGKNGTGAPQRKRFLCEALERGRVVKTIWDDVGTTTNGTRCLKDIFGDIVFSNPKPVELIKRIVGLSTMSSERSTVLDFFAGSGTTGHAILDLNKEDGGHRQFILCTNNGDKGPDSVKIAEDITYPRIKTVITGKRQDGSKYSDGIPANLRYYKIEHKEKKTSIDANRLEIVRYLEDIIQVKENAFEQIEVNEDLALYKNSEQFVGMVFEPFALEEIIESIKEKNSENKPVKLYVFSYSRDAFEDNFGTDFEIEFVAMPEGLLKTYASIVAETKKEDA